MGQIFDLAKRIDAAIAKKGLVPAKVRGAIAIKVGFSLALVSESTPDDATKLAALKAAAREVLGEPV